MERQKIIDILNNVIDEIDRATERIEELGEFNENSVTPDEELVTDLYVSKDRLYQIMLKYI
jgi:hypothetical protein